MNIWWKRAWAYSDKMRITGSASVTDLPVEKCTQLLIFFLCIRGICSYNDIFCETGVVITFPNFVKCGPCFLACFLFLTCSKCDIGVFLKYLTIVILFFYFYGATNYIGSISFGCKGCKVVVSFVTLWSSYP